MPSSTLKKQKKLIILDRDGVINLDSKNFIKSEEEWLPIPGSLEAIAALTQQGFQVVIATNQSGIARGYFDFDTLDRIHHKLQEALRKVGGNLSGIYVCPHGPLDNCACRKPKPGLYSQIARDYALDFKTDPVFSIGDSLRDIEAALAAGCKPVLVLTGNGEKTAKQLSSAENVIKNAENIPIYADLQAAVLSLFLKNGRNGLVCYDGR